MKTYRSDSTPPTPPKKEFKMTRKQKIFMYVASCVASLCVGGFACEFFSRHLTEGHASVTSIYVGLASIIFALYFVIAALVEVDRD